MQLVKQPRSLERLFFLSVRYLFSVHRRAGLAYWLFFGALQLHRFMPWPEPLRAIHSLCFILPALGYGYLLAWMYCQTALAWSDQPTRLCADLWQVTRRFPRVFLAAVFLLACPVGLLFGLVFLWHHAYPLGGPHGLFLIVLLAAGFLTLLLYIKALYVLPALLMESTAFRAAFLTGWRVCGSYAQGIRIFGLYCGFFLLYFIMAEHTLHTAFLAEQGLLVWRDILVCFVLLPVLMSVMVLLREDIVQRPSADLSA
jgi:hypothetical protein